MLHNIERFVLLWCPTWPADDHIYEMMETRWPIQLPGARAVEATVEVVLESEAL